MRRETTDGQEEVYGQPTDDAAETVIGEKHCFGLLEHATGLRFRAGGRAYFLPWSHLILAEAAEDGSRLAIAFSAGTVHVHGGGLDALLWTLQGLTLASLAVSDKSPTQDRVSVERIEWEPRQDD